MLGDLQFGLVGKSQHSGNAAELGQGLQGDSANYRLLGAFGRGAGNHRRAAEIRLIYHRAENAPWVLNLLMTCILIAAGWLMEAPPSILVLAPLLKSLADNIGMHAVRFCIMKITALGVGFNTLPPGLTLFVFSEMTGASILKIAARAVPFV